MSFVTLQIVDYCIGLSDLSHYVCVLINQFISLRALAVCDQHDLWIVLNSVLSWKGCSMSIYRPICIFLYYMFQARSQDRFFWWGVRDAQKSGPFQLQPLNPPTKTPFLAHLVAKSGPFGRFGGCNPPGYGPGMCFISVLIENIMVTAKNLPACVICILPCLEISQTCKIYTKMGKII